MRKEDVIEFVAASMIILIATFVIWTGFNSRVKANEKQPNVCRCQIESVE